MKPTTFKPSQDYFDHMGVLRFGLKFFYEYLFDFSPLCVFTCLLKELGSVQA